MQVDQDVAQKAAKVTRIIGYTILSLIILFFYVITVVGYCDGRCYTVKDWLITGWATIVMYAILVGFVTFFSRDKSQDTDTTENED